MKCHSSILAILVVFLIWSATFLIMHFSPGIDKSGQFGDSFGAATSLFTGLGLLGVWFTMRQQGRSEEDARQRELLNTRIAAISAALEAKTAIAAQIDVSLNTSLESGLPLEPNQQTMLLATKKAALQDILRLNAGLDQLLARLSQST